MLLKYMLRTPIYESNTKKYIILLLRRKTNMKYFKVVARCGHVGKNKYIDKVFYVKANNKKEAAKIVRNNPRVKHDCKDVIPVPIEEITLEEYCQGLKIMEEDPYFHVHNRQDQKILCPDLYKEIFHKEETQPLPKRGYLRHRKYEALQKESKFKIEEALYE